MKAMMGRIRHMIKKEFIQIFRDRKMKPIIFVTPVIQLIVFGYAVTMDVTNIRTAVFDLDKTSVTRKLALAPVILTAEGWEETAGDPVELTQIEKLTKEAAKP